MICNQCGQEIQEDSTFCVHCGAKQEIEAPISYVPKKRRVGLVALLVAVVVCITLTAIFIVLGGSDKRKIQEQLDLGAKYLEELNYEQAILQYKLVLETDIQNKEALTKISEAYGLMAETETEYARRIEAYDMAIEYALSACEYYPEDTTLQEIFVSTYMNAGDYCLESDKLEDAEQRYKDAKKWAQKFLLIVEVRQIDIKLAEIEQLRKEMINMRCLEMLNEIWSTSALLIYNECFYLDDEREELARHCVKLVEEFLELNEEYSGEIDFMTIDVLRWAYLCLGEYEMAESVAKEYKAILQQHLECASRRNEVCLDQYGRKIYEKNVYDDGRSSTTATKFEGNRLISIETQELREDSIFIDERKYIYDNQGRIEMELHTMTIGNKVVSNSITEYEYDGNNVKIWYTEDESTRYLQDQFEIVYDWKQYR